MEFVFIALKIEIVLLLSFTGPEDEVGLIF